ncbi:hypothetical protein CEF21_05650 [Bacillus sp. FJAT-42376]|uniref:YczE/YyaS/YitT family protein n=1 Tax=Bacillus sp. FJAT-42376 TaxID=2014076 RepID=UPI000F514EB4|nr:hypothetical protein [Bacillus sp. FJAT-42376]AZB41828.1 hypothetical protein CEF21_05650 [Bacillus sp. FJAT-42376]
MRYSSRLGIFFIGLLIFSYGIAMAIQVQYLGVSPWDMLNIALRDRFGLTIGTWTILVGLFLIVCSLFIGRKYINIGTFLNAVLVGVFVDAFLFTGFLPRASSLPADIAILLLAIITMGIGGGMYSAAGIGAGPRDGFMLSLSDKTGISISRVRIMMESLVVIIGLVIGGPVFIFTFIYPFVQSPIYQRSYLVCSKWIANRSAAREKELAS